MEIKFNNKTQKNIDNLFLDIETNNRMCFDYDNEGPTIVINFVIENGKVLPFDEDTHFGNTILTDDEILEIIKDVMSYNVIGDNIPNGFVRVHKDKYVID